MASSHSKLSACASGMPSACVADERMAGVRLALAGNTAYLSPGSAASWRSGHAADCKSVYTGSIPVLASMPPIHRGVTGKTAAHAVNRSRSQASSDMQGRRRAEPGDMDRCRIRIVPPARLARALVSAHASSVATEHASIADGPSSEAGRDVSVDKQPFPESLRALRPPQPSGPERLPARRHPVRRSVSAVGERPEPTRDGRNSRARILRQACAPVSLRSHLRVERPLVRRIDASVSANAAIPKGLGRTADGRP